MAMINVWEIKLVDDPKEKPVRTQVSGKLQRWMDYGGSDWEKHGDGRWCKAEDVEKLEAENKKLAAMVLAMAADNENVDEENEKLRAAILGVDPWQDASSDPQVTFYCIWCGAEKSYSCVRPKPEKHADDCLYLALQGDEE